MQRLGAVAVLCASWFCCASASADTSVGPNKETPKEEPKKPPYTGRINEPARERNEPKVPEKVPDVLEAVVSGKLPLEPLVILYDDLHPLHGGLMLAVHGDGRVDQEARRESVGKPRKVSRENVLKLLALVRKHQAWEQRTPERAPVPDESRARLTIAWRDRQSVIWEWYNDLGKNARMIEIRELMKQIAWESPPR
jgi:hypothetical protein